MPQKKRKKKPRKPRPEKTSSICCALDLTEIAPAARTKAEKNLVAKLIERHAGDVRELAVELTPSEARRIAAIVERLPGSSATPQQPPQTAAPATPNPYERHKVRAAARNKALAAAGRDIGAPPECANRKRRDACRRNLLLFLEQYFPNAFPLDWSEDHLRIIAKIEKRILSGGLQAVAMPRGNGKSSIMERAVIWAALYGHARYAMLIAANSPKAGELLDSIKTELECNDAVADDFPAAIYPIRCLERIANRSKGQLCQGRPTRIEWRKNYIVLPTIDAAPSSSAILAAEGIASAVRGSRKTLSTGEIVRPDLALIDDPSTRMSAKSPLENTNRERIIAADVLGMAGPGHTIAALAAVTVIFPDDLASRLLDRKRNPAWHGETTKLLYKFPSNMELWNQYGDILTDELAADGDGQAATAFYIKHQKKMDAGSRVAWPARKPGCASALEFAMRLFHTDLLTFQSEYQNDPLKPEDHLTGVSLSADAIVSRISGNPRHVIPAGSEFLTAFIDVQKNLLYYAVVAWRRDFTGEVVDYGSYPEQPRIFYTLGKASPTIADAHPAGGLEAKLYAAITALTGDLLTRDWRREDGADIQIDRLNIDANWQTDIVYDAVANSPHRARITPANGVFVGATSRPFADYRKRRGDVAGSHWRIPALSRGRRSRYMLVDVNFWKSFIAARLTTPLGDAGTLTFWKAEPLRHQMIASHITAEYRITVEARGRKVDEWKIKPDKPDNHLFDCIVGAAAAANRLGAALPGVAGGRPQTRQPIRLSDLQGRR
jgi:hypothetical protein